MWAPGCWCFPLNFFCFWPCRVFIAAYGHSLVVVSWGYSPVAVWWLLLLRSTGSRARGLEQSWGTDSVAPRHVGSSRARDRTCVLCIGTWILNLWTTREVLDVAVSRPWVVFLHVPASEHRHLIFPGKYWEKGGLALPWGRAPVTCSGLTWQMTEFLSFMIFYYDLRFYYYGEFQTYSRYTRII